MLGRIYTHFEGNENGVPLNAMIGDLAEEGPHKRISAQRIRNSEKIFGLKMF